MKLNLDENQENQDQDVPSTSPPPKKKMNIKKYEEISADEIPMKKLSLGLWWVKNRLKLRAILIIFLTIISVISWGYTFYYFGDYLFFGMKEDQGMFGELSRTKVLFSEDLRAKDLSVSGVGVIKTEEKYDLYAKIVNPNRRHWGIFHYCFLVSGEKVECGNGFIFPEESKYILALSQEFNRQPMAIRLEVKNLLWKRTNLHKIPDWKKFKDARLAIDITDAIFTPAETSGLSEKLNLNTLKFKATNNTAFSYWEVPLTILLYRGNRIVGINQYTLKKFISNDLMEVKITWLGILSGVSEIEIIPDINIMDEGIYMNP